jgi:hypothetical protein
MAEDKRQYKGNRLATGGEAVEERREAEKFLDGENYFYLFFFVLACAFVI